MNVTDGKFFTKTTGGTVKEVGGAASVTLNSVLTAGNIAATDIVLDQGSQLVFEGNLGNAFETFLDAVEPTADNIVKLPNQSGTLATEGDNLAFSIVFGG